jgi:hypothetical protein
MLEHALTEPNPSRKQDFVKKGFKALESDICKVDLSYVLPLLIKN